jgi:hypothetical protein
VLFDFFMVRKHIYVYKAKNSTDLEFSLVDSPISQVQESMSTHIAVLCNGNCTTVIIAFAVNVSKGEFVRVGTFFLTLLGGLVFV